MSEKLVDARNLDCPEPVVRARNAMLEAGVDCVRVRVTGEVPAENIQRLARSQGWTPVVEHQEAEIVLTLTRGAAQETQPMSQPQRTTAAQREQVVVLISSNLFGVGEERLGQILMRAFLKTLRDTEPRPAKILFVNSGVFLTTEGSELLDDLQHLQQAGIEILSCGTCLDYYRKLDALRVGVVTNMFDIATALLQADRIVRP